MSSGNDAPRGSSRDKKHYRLSTITSVGKMSKEQLREVLRMYLDQLNASEHSSATTSDVETARRATVTRIMLKLKEFLDRFDEVADVLSDYTMTYLREGNEEALESIIRVLIDGMHRVNAVDELALILRTVFQQLLSKRRSTVPNMVLLHIARNLRQGGHDPIHRSRNERLAAKLLPEALSRGYAFSLPYFGDRADQRSFASQWMDSIAFKRFTEALKEVTPDDEPTLAMPVLMGVAFQDLSTRLGTLEPEIQKKIGLKILRPLLKHEAFRAFVGELIEGPKQYEKSAYDWLAPLGSVLRIVGRFSLKHLSEPGATTYVTALAVIGEHQDYNEFKVLSNSVQAEVRKLGYDLIGTMACHSEHNGDTTLTKGEAFGKLMHGIMDPSEDVAISCLSLLMQLMDESLDSHLVDLLTTIPDTRLSLKERLLDALLPIARTRPGLFKGVYPKLRKDTNYMRRVVLSQDERPYYSKLEELVRTLRPKLGTQKTMPRIDPAPRSR